MPSDDHLVKTRHPKSTTEERTRGLVSGRSSGRRIEAHSYKPPTDLIDVVSTFWAGRWDLPPEAPHTTELLSDPCLHIVFETGGAHEGGRLVGAWTKLWVRRLSGRGLVRGVKIHAGGARAFIGRPICNFTNRITPLEDAFGSAVIRRISEVLRAQDDISGFDIIAKWLREIRRGGGDPEIKLAMDICQLISQDLSLTSVEQLARVTGLSPRTLQRLFRNYVGGTPKWTITRNRLQEAAARLERGEECSLALLAAELGFTDQAHFARDFKRATGKAPGRFRQTVHQ